MMTKIIKKLTVSKKTNEITSEYAYAGLEEMRHKNSRR